MEKRKTILVIDAHAMAYRAHFALERQNLTNAAGQNTGAIFGFFRMFFKILQDFTPEETLVAWDPPGGGFRGDMYKEYKATRKPMPDDLRSQISEIKEIVRNMGFATCEVPGFEADDVMGSMATRFGKASDVLLLTSDKDCFQLITKNVSMLKGAKGVTEFVRVDPAWVENEIGVRPDQIPEYMALVGDTSDNIPGAKGIGPKTAAELIQQYKSIDGIYKNLPRIAKESVRKKLQESESDVRLSRDLATIRTDIKEVLDFPEAKLRTPDYLREDVVQFFRQEGYRAIAEDLRRAAEKRRGKAKVAAASVAQEGEDVSSSSAQKKSAGKKDAASSTKPKQKSKKGALDQGTLFEEEPEQRMFSGKEHFLGTDVEYEMVTDAEQLKRALREHNRSVVVVDTETDSADPMRARLVGISISAREKKATYIPLPPPGSPYESAGLALNEVRSLLKEFFGEKTRSFVGQNIKYDYTVLRRHGMPLNAVAFDTMLAGYLLNPNIRRNSLDDLALDYLDYSTIRYEDVVGTGRKQVTMDQLPPANIRDYACEDADLTLRLHQVLGRKLKENKLLEINDSLEVPLIPVLADMEVAGMAIDLQYFKELSRDYKQKITKLEKKIFEEAGQVFNVNSTRELQFVLIEKLKLPMAKKIKTGFSTDQKELDRMRGMHPMIDHLLEYRKYTKLLGTYIDALPELVHPETGKLHTNFHQAVAATGRLSSMDPNLQNIPVREDTGKAIRRGFVCSKGRVLLSLDYSQVELRIMAHYSHDPALMEAFTRD
ncbi:MAG TPA: DNA polymerase I, partial [Leptospiraceae bacterium]|nr:DNA polymerase I [Leptospiraceae bacterium]HMY46473.1 DNA polymerase I [Leptospiraceae bacterium]